MATRILRKPKKGIKKVVFDRLDRHNAIHILSRRRNSFLRNPGMARCRWMDQASLIAVLAHSSHAYIHQGPIPTPALAHMEHRASQRPLKRKRLKRPRSTAGPFSLFPLRCQPIGYYCCRRIAIEQRHKCRPFNHEDIF